MTSAPRRSSLVRRLRLPRVCAATVLVGCLSAALAAQDPSKDPVALATEALASRDRKRLAAVLPDLRARVQVRRDASPAMLLLWGRAERFAGHPDSAIAAFSAYEDTQEHPGLGALETARTFLARGFADGAEAWYAAVVDADDSTWAAIRSDLQPIFTPEEAEAFPSLTTPAERSAWARRFWAERDARDLRDAGERIVEHYRRLDFARANFRLPDRPRQYLPGTRFKSGSTELDDRGIIYVRHGRPTRIARFGSDGPVTDITGLSEGLQDYTAPLPPNETWEYASPDGTRFFTFVACATLGPGLGFIPGGCVPPLDYHLVESMLDVFGPGVSRRVASGAGNLGSRDNLFASVIQRAILERAPMGPRFANLLTTDRYTLPVFAEQERRESSRDVEVGTTTDGFAHQFEEGLEARIEVLVAGREGADGLVHVTYAIRGGTLDATKSADGWLYPVRTRVQVRSERDSVLATADDRRVFRAARPLGRRETVLGRVGVRVPPGAHALRLVIEQDERRGTAVGRQAIEVPLVAEGRLLQSSDLVLGQEANSVAWQRSADDTVRINPTGTFVSDAGVELFQEIYGLPAGTPYRWSLRVEKDRGFFGKLTGKDALALSLSGEERSLGAVSEIRRFLDISRLAPGKYMLEMKVEAEGRKPVTRKRGIVVEPPR